MARLYDTSRAWLTTMAALALAVAMVACRAGEEGAVPAADGPTATPTAPSALPPFEVSQPWRIGFVSKSALQGSPFWQMATQGALEAASEAGVELLVRHPQSETDIDGQIAIVRQLVDGGADAIVLAPTSSQLLATAVDTAAQAGTPVIVMDTPLNSSAMRTYVGIDNLAAAEHAGRWVARQLGDGATVAVLLGSPGQQNAIERRDGFLLGLRTADISVVGVETAHWDEMSAYRIALEWLQRFDELDGIVASNDPMAMGALRAVHDLGRDNVLVTGFDGGPEAVAAVARGDLGATVDQAPASQATLAVNAALAILEGVPVPAHLRVDAVLVTPESP